MLSIVIPCYEMYGKGVQFLERALESIENQTYKDIEIVISDNSDDNAIKNLCKDFFVNYFRNPEKGMGANTNYGIDHATGDLIKILYQDDYLAHENALYNVINNIGTKMWLVSGSQTGDQHHLPIYNEQIYIGNNTVGSPSVLTISKEVSLRFNSLLKWVVDCDYYKRMWDKYGQPFYLNSVDIVIGTGEYQQTHQLSQEVKNQEIEQLIQKYAPQSFQ